MQTNFTVHGQPPQFPRASAANACESCLVWNHLKCVGLTASPKKVVWFCRLCHGTSDEVQRRETANSKSRKSVPLLQKNDVRKTDLEPSQCCRRRRKRKLLIDCTSKNQHNTLERFSKLISDIKKGEKLSDEHINATSQLLHGQFEDVQGLCSPVLGQKLLFPKFQWASGYAGYAYFQILHTGSDHWIAIKAISESEVYVYDSIFMQPTYYTLKQIASILHAPSSQILLHLERVQMQSNSVDCGVYAIAFLTDLCYGKDPASCRYASTEVRNHLVTCFENGHLTLFPSSAVKKKKALMKQVNVYCQCRLPYVLEHMKNPGNEVAVMVQCYICDNLYHFSCVNLSLDQKKRIKRTKEIWMCDYKGCNNAFGDLFDSDSD